EFTVIVFINSFCRFASTRGVGILPGSFLSICFTVSVRGGAIIAFEGLAFAISFSVVVDGFVCLVVAVVVLFGVCVLATGGVVFFGVCVLATGGVVFFGVCDLATGGVVFGAAILGGVALAMGGLVFFLSASCSR